MQAWASVYRQFGARPKLYKNGCLALAKRECVPRINVLVDMYNAVAMTYMLPIGGEDWDALQSNLLRTTARGNEEFIGNEPDSVPEHPCRGEPIWLDRAGVTTRRFNWRQAWRTRITPSTRAAYFVLDTVAPYTPAQLGAATQGLLGLLHQRPGAVLLRRQKRSEARHGTRSSLLALPAPAELPRRPGPDTAGPVSPAATASARSRRRVWAAVRRRVPR